MDGTMANVDVTNCGTGNSSFIDCSRNEIDGNVCILADDGGFYSVCEWDYLSGL